MTPFDGENHINGTNRRLGLNIDFVKARNQFVPVPPAINLKVFPVQLPVELVFHFEIGKIAGHSLNMIDAFQTRSDHQIVQQVAGKSGSQFGHHKSLFEGIHRNDNHLRTTFGQRGKIGLSELG